MSAEPDRRGFEPPPYPYERLDSFKPLEKKVSEATLALETMAKSTNKFATDTLAQMRTTPPAHVARSTPLS
ncbi:MAG: hypothetical protein EBY80_11270 [Actinobacteria bacterium]|nr:hypothetical protein [Actinomycetota bacterium]